MLPKRIFFPLAILAMLGIGLWAFSTQKVHSPTTPSAPQNITYSYRDEKFHFHLDYPSEFRINSAEENAILPWSYLTTIPGTRILTLRLFSEFQPNTNFSEAFISVGISSNPDARAFCRPPEITADFESQELGGIPFLLTERIEGAAGRRYQTKSYRTERDDTCFLIETVIHSTNLGNYDPEQNISEFDQAAVEEEMNTVLESFRFEE